jgi:hypothetical protein
MTSLFTRLAVTAALALAAIDPALAFDHTKLGTVLKADVSGGKVDYVAMKASPADLDAYVASVAAASGTQKLGFYLNAYNALVMKALIAEAQLPVKVTDISGFFDNKKYTVAGKSMTLNELETFVRTTWKDPRIHFALNCGAVSCPPIYAAVFPEDDAALDMVLTDLTSKFLNGNGLLIDDAKKELQITKLMDWYKDDFVAKEGSIENFLKKYVTDPTKKAQLEAGIAAGYTVTYRFYDWRPNAK